MSSGPDARVLIIQKHHDFVNRGDDAMTRDYLGRHLSSPPRRVDGSGDKCVGRTVVPRVQEAAKRPNFWPITVETASAPFENCRGRRASEYGEERGCWFGAVQYRNTLRDN